MKVLYYLLFLSTLTASCSTYQATTKKHQKLNYDAIRVEPKWERKEIKGKKWITVALGTTLGAAYGYSSEFTYEDKTYRGEKNAIIWGGIGMVAGGLINGILFPSRNFRKRSFELEHTDRWLRDFNRSMDKNYIAYKREPDNHLVLVPKDRVNDMQRYEQARDEKEIAKVKAEEDRIRIEQENRKRRQFQALRNEEMRKNIVEHLDWEPITITSEKEVYPSALITSSSYTGNSQSRRSKDISNYLGIDLTSHVEGTSTLNYEIVSLDHRFLSKSTGTVKLSGRKRIFLEINWIMSELLSNKETTPMKVSFRIKDEAGNYAEKVLDLVMMSINECILYQNNQIINWMLPAYVNEQNPLIDNILKEALEKGYVDKWTGYQLDAREVLRQVQAIWMVLSDRKMRYSDITGAGNVGNGKIYSQHIRTVTDALQEKQVNCIDGTILFASILKRIGINPYIVLYPGHANLAFDLVENDSETKKYLEITTLPEAPFKLALEVGFKKYLKVPLSDIYLIDISHARKSGIKPFGS